MFKIESYVTPILLSYVDKYVRDFKPADAQVSLWGGGVALHNLVLKADVLQQEVSLPFTLVSGRIHELLIQVPWTKIMSEPIVVTIDTIECVLSLNPPPTDENAPPEPQRRTQVVEAPPGYMQALVRRIVSNIALRVHHLIVKYVQDDIVLSLNVKHLAVDSAGSTWEPAFADIEQNEPTIRRLVRLDDLTLCLDRADSDGKIRFYQEPLLYKCQLDLRVLTRLVSANTRRASSLSVHLRSSKLAWGVTNDQLALLLRLVRERPNIETKTAPPAPKAPMQSASMHSTSPNSAEPARQESWSEWAWSWLPALADREGAVEEAPTPATPIPLHFVAFLDDVSLVFKVMEVEGSVRKRARGVLELCASHAAIKSSVRSPTMLRVRVGMRALSLSSRGKCTCGHLSRDASRDEPTIYLRKLESDPDEPWVWPKEDLSDLKVELAEVADELKEDQITSQPILRQRSDILKMSEQVMLTLDERGNTSESASEVDPLWHKMAPVVFLEYTHERSPPLAFTNPYENPPLNFQYSDWEELCDVKVQLKPLELRVCMGLLHRIDACTRVLVDLPLVPSEDLPMRTLTVEECEALLENLPLRRVSVRARDLRVLVEPWDHSSERAAAAPLTLQVLLPRAVGVLSTPLYPHRVCAAACQLPVDTGPLWQGARAHISGSLTSAQVLVSEPGAASSRPCARADLRIVTHTLLNKHLFKRESVVLSYSVKIREANICGSAPRLQAAWYVPYSLLTEKPTLLKQSTLAHDALHDEESVAVDLTVEELTLRGYLTNNMNTHIMSIQSARATAFHAPRGGELKQAWIFSAPDVPTTTPYVRAAVQWCNTVLPNSLDYVGLWTEPVSFCVDPLFIAWLAYSPAAHPHGGGASEHVSCNLSRSSSSTQYLLRRRATPPLSSSRLTSRTGSGAELVHGRRSMGSGSEPSDRRERDLKPTRIVPKPAKQWWSGEQLGRLHERLQRMLVSVELGLVLLYLSSGSVSALDCATVRDAMERHAHLWPVLALSMGHFSIHSNSTKKHLWQTIRHDGPTFLSESERNESDDSFPWKMRLADVSCYTLEAVSERAADRALRSPLKVTAGVAPKTVLEMVTTTVTLSVVTKSMLYKTTIKKNKHHACAEEERMKYFTAGMDFKPSTLKEFFRGPANRKESTQGVDANLHKEPEEKEIVTSGPLVSLGVHLHADTPPLIVRIDHEQMHVVASALHGLQHMVRLLQCEPQVVESALQPPSSTTGTGAYTLHKRSVSEQDGLRSPSDDTQSESKDELISIFESTETAIESATIKTSLWCQWVVSRATLVVATSCVKLAFDVDDIISTIDLQPHYNQVKIKVASASVRHYEREVSSNDWKAGVLGGRVLEAREPTSAMEENHFMAITITQAQLSNLPANWKEELHPKVLADKTGVDTMWEIYATLAPLEVVVQPAILENVASLLEKFAPRSFCPLKDKVAQREVEWLWPFCYVNAGGLRLLLTTEDEVKRASDTNDADDTFVIIVGRLTVNPHPENPICRRGVNTGRDSSWLGGSSPFEGRQYEVLVSKFAVRTAQFHQLVYQETSQTGLLKGTGGENPALKWSQPHVSPTITPLLHSVDIGFVLAPATFARGVLTSGPAFEVNLVSDCALELSLAQLGLLHRAATDIARALHSSTAEDPLEQEQNHVCPYTSLLMIRPGEDVVSTPSESTLSNGTRTSGETSAQSLATDSGVDTVTSRSTKAGSRLDDHSVFAKKSVSIMLAEPLSEASEYLEVFVTMGVIELSLYAADDGSPALGALRPPSCSGPAAPVPQLHQVKIAEEDPSESTAKKEDGVPSSHSPTRSITETVRQAGVGQTKLEHTYTLADLPLVRKLEGNLPLLHVTLQQPNLYYWKRRSHNSLQVSLFNAWVGLGAGQLEEHWHAPLLITGKGVLDPVTDIPPALITMNLTAPVSSVGSSGRGNLRIEVERPVQLEVCSDRLRRICGILRLVKEQFPKVEEANTAIVSLPFLFRLRRAMMNNAIESVTIQTSQLSVSGPEGRVGCEGTSLQLAASGRADRLTTRSLVSALLIASSTSALERRPPLLPLTLGIDMEATWEAWRRAEGGTSACEPTVRVVVDVDSITVDLRPEDFATMRRIQEALNEFFPAPEETIESDESVSSQPEQPTQEVRRWLVEAPGEREDHYYKDDLRSGAFKIVSGGQLPMAYQVTLHRAAVAWRYPHPRAITRLVAFPLPYQAQEIPCVLEMYSPMLESWQAHTYFKLPVDEPRELMLYVTPPDAVFAQTWRFRAITDREQRRKPFEFKRDRFVPRLDPLMFECTPEMQVPAGTAQATAEQLSGVVRVDSYFAPRALPRQRIALRVASANLHMHNSLPAMTSAEMKHMEGYYVSRPLMRSHRVLTISARDCIAFAHLGSPTGYKAMCDTAIGSDVLQCTTGTMVPLVEEFRCQAGLSVPESETSNTRLRCCGGAVRGSLDVPRLNTLVALVADCQQFVYGGKAIEKSVSPYEQTVGGVEPPAGLSGRVSLWLHNTCACALRVGQEGTDEAVPLGPGALLAYRWRSPTADKRLRLAFAGPSPDWHWSSSIPFTGGTYRVRLSDTEPAGAITSTSTNGGASVGAGAGVFAHVTVSEACGRRCMQLAGRLALANMLRRTLLYKVRTRNPENSQWRTICTGELSAESVGPSVVCGAYSELALKIKFPSHELGWSGDIPLKECPKENVPWLVKVPSDGEVPYVSVWCRVVRARSDGRVLATVWPLYVLHSRLPLDTDILIATEPKPGTSSPSEEEKAPPPPLVQTALGRGATTHLLAPGTTQARHQLSFQYRDIECPVTREAVPLHYGVTDVSVFEKRAPINTIDEVVTEIYDWLSRAGEKARSAWPYSLVSNHWAGKWHPALLQPRCDVTVRYQAVRAGGGCSLELQLCPVVLLCNATPIALTLRAHDAAPLCKLEPGSAISPGSAVLKKPFFMSVEVGRETFVSGQLVVSDAEPGRYGAPPPGHVALDYAANIAIHCNHKIALLTMYYEIKQDINLLGVSTTYELVNRLDTRILVSAIAAPSDTSPVTLQPKTLKMIEPSNKNSIHGTPLSRFWLLGRWHSGGDPSELMLFLCIALPNGSCPAGAPVPVRLGMPPFRRAISVIDHMERSVPVVVTQLRHEGRWLVSVAADPCPQFVVVNRTNTPLCVGEPAAGDASTSSITAEPECAGARFLVTVPADDSVHYSSPGHCARYPPAADLCATSPQLVTFARHIEDSWNPGWCPPVSVTDGEQLLQLPGGETVKLRVRSHPHSTLLELQPVDQNDISASDIRKRLLGSFISKDTLNLGKKGVDGSRNLERTPAEEKLFGPYDIEAVDNEGGPADAGETKQQKDATTIETLMVVLNEDEKECELGHGSSDGLKAFKGPKESKDAMTALFQDVNISEWNACAAPWLPSERARCVLESVVVEVAGAADTPPLVALHLDRAALLVCADGKRTKTTFTVSGVQIDNLQYATGQYDFGVIATTPTAAKTEATWLPLWTLLADRDAFGMCQESAGMLVNAQRERWTVADRQYDELTEVEIAVGPLALYVEDAYVSALVELARVALPVTSETANVAAEMRALEAPLRLQVLHIKPLALTLTLHTAVRMYIALDQSPLRLGAFRLQHAMTSVERLTHALTVHYLSAVILGAGWVVGGLELLGAPGALAARVGGASGGVRGVASAAAAALVRSLSAWAGSLARNLDLLAGDEEHARRAAAARRRPPPSLVAGLVAGITNFAINILGAVGGLAHHPLVGVAVGESESGATALRRGLVGALTKPLSATADLLAYAGHGLLTQTGWDPVPQPRPSRWSVQGAEAEVGPAGWRRDCVRWSFRLADLVPLDGFEVLLDATPLLLLLTHKFLVVADAESEKVVETIDFKYCTVAPFLGYVVELHVAQARSTRFVEANPMDEDDEYQLNVAAMARVARYTGADGVAAGAAGVASAAAVGAGVGGAGPLARTLLLRPVAGRAHALHAALSALVHHNSEAHLPLL